MQTVFDEADPERLTLVDILGYAINTSTVYSPMK
jgi:hypothetical protein